MVVQKNNYFNADGFVPVVSLTPAMAATEMAPIRSPGLINRTKAGVPHSGTDCEGRCWDSTSAPSSRTSLY
jgi:hypothetical protein